jgi:hypothetical protein
MSPEDLKKFLHDLGSDLSDRRLLPLVGLVCAGLLAAIVFAATGGSSSPATQPAPPAVQVAKAGLPVSEATPGSRQAVAETVGGVEQRRGSSRDPFEPLPSAVKATLVTSVPAGKAATTASSSSKSSSASGGGGGGSSTTTAPKTEAPPSKPTSPPKEKAVVRYAVTAEFGTAPASEGAAAQLRPYPALKLDEPLPAENPQLVFLGVTLKSGKYAVFALTGEAILHGAGKCVPSATHCQAVELAAGQVETLESFDATGHPANYELKVVAIARSITTAAGASVSGPGSQLLQSSATLPIDGVRYSAENGVLATAVH